MYPLLLGVSMGVDLKMYRVGLCFGWGEYGVLCLGLKHTQQVARAREGNSEQLPKNLELQDSGQEPQSGCHVRWGVTAQLLS